MGAIGIALAILYLVIIMHGSLETNIFWWLNILYMFVFGIFCVLVGLGYSPEKFFGSAYVHVDDEHIAIKPGIRKKEQSIPWDRIKSMEYKANWFHIIQTDGSASKFSLSNLEFRVLIEARDAIWLMAVEKGITIN
jgi:uncharacterized membrane protein YdbT with pleckstrin-like domain